MPYLLSWREVDLQLKAGSVCPYCPAPDIAHLGVGNSVRGDQRKCIIVPMVLVTRKNLFTVTGNLYSRWYKAVMEARTRELITFLENNTELDVNAMARELHMERKPMWTHVFRWAGQYDFRIDGETLVVQKDDLEYFIKELESHYDAWNQET